MHWELTEEQDAYREALRGWLGDVSGPEQVRAWWESLDVDAASVASVDLGARMRKDGMAGVGIAEDLGGQGGGVVELALTAEELGRAVAPSGGWLATVLAATAVAGASAVSAEVVEHGGALLVDSGALPTSARGLDVDADGRVSGRVDQVLGAADGAVLLVLVEDDGRPALRRLTTSDGVTISSRRLLDRSRTVGDVVLEAVASEAVDVDAGEALRAVTDLAGVLVAADALGAMQRMLDMAVEYSLQRQQFGVPIGSFQAVKHAAASILVDVEAGRSGVYYAAASLEARHDERSLHAAAVKAQVTDAGAHAADTALTMHGAIGYTWEHDLHLSYKRAKLDRALLGAPGVWHDRLADGLALTP